MSKDRPCDRTDDHEGHQWRREIPSRNGGTTTGLAYCPGLGVLADEPATTLRGGIL